MQINIQKTETVDLDPSKVKFGEPKVELGAPVRPTSNNPEDIGSIDISIDPGIVTDKGVKIPADITFRRKITLVDGKPSIEPSDSEVRYGHVIVGGSQRTKYNTVSLVYLGIAAAKFNKWSETDEGKKALHDLLEAKKNRIANRQRQAAQQRRQVPPINGFDNGEQLPF